MALRPPDNPLDSGLETIKAYFDKQLEKLDLTEQQIERQDLDELRQSLQRINDAIANPDSFGELRISYSADAGAFIATSRSQYHQKIGVLPILLERKKLILERIKELSTDEKIESLQDLVTQIDDTDLKERLNKQLESIQASTAEYQEETRDVAKREAEEKIKLEQEVARQNLELLERRSKIWLTFLQRESVATIIGSIVLLLLTFTLILGMFMRTEESEILSNGFLVILGYFFGQSTSRSTKTEGITNV